MIYANIDSVIQNKKVINFHIYINKFSYIYRLIDLRERRRERKREISTRDISQLPPIHLLLGIQPTAQARALHQTSDLLGVWDHAQATEHTGGAIFLR